jgi:transcriptional regulator with XRE-family HTH domain
MPTKEELGRRLRMARFEKDLTLKEVAARCGMSATHISEVERGKTSPTIGALERICDALEENPAHFVREESFPRALLTHETDQRSNYMRDVEGRSMQYSFLSPGLADGMLQVFERRMPPGSKTTSYPRIAEMVLLCMSGMVRVTVADESNVLRDGDSIQLRMDEGVEIEVLGDEEHHGIAVFAAPVLIPS